jgi:hypothetical protein
MKCIMLILTLLLSSLAVAEDTKADSQVAVASGPVTVCHSAGGSPGASTPGEIVSECEKRDVARLFLVAGKPDAALRVLCTTMKAREAFGDDKSGTPVKCLKAVGLDNGK